MLIRILDKSVCGREISQLKEILHNTGQDQECGLISVSGGQIYRLCMPHRTFLGLFKFLHLVLVVKIKKINIKEWAAVVTSQLQNAKEQMS